MIGRVLCKKKSWLNKEPKNDEERRKKKMKRRRKVKMLDNTLKDTRKAETHVKLTKMNQDKRGGGRRRRRIEPYSHNHLE